MHLNDLFESDELTLRVDMRGYHHGQSDQTLWAIRDGRQVGYVDFVDYHGEPSIQMIEVADDERKKGYATTMLRYLQSLYPDQEIKWGTLTDDGAKLYAAVPKVEIIDDEIKKKFDRLEQLKQQEAEFEKKANAIHAKSPISYKDRRAMDGLVVKWNDLHDELHDLEAELDGAKPSKILIK